MANLPKRPLRGTASFSSLDAAVLRTNAYYPKATPMAINKPIIADYWNNCLVFILCIKR